MRRHPRPKARLHGPALLGHLVCFGRQPFRPRAFPPRRWSSRARRGLVNCPLPRTVLCLVGAAGNWLAVPARAAWPPACRAAPSGAGSTKMPSAPGSTAAGYFRAIPPWRPRPVGSSISRRESGQDSLGKPMNSCFRPTRRPVSQHAVASTPPALRDPSRPCRWNTSTSDVGLGPTSPRSMFTVPNSSVVASRKRAANLLTAWWSKRGLSTP